MKQKRIPEVITRLESFLKEKPDSIPQWVTLALLCAQQGDRNKEAAAYEHILTVNPAFLTALNNLAYLYAGPLDKPQRALELARQARTSYPESPEVADTLGWILFQQEKHPEALALIEEAAGKLPDSPEVQYHLGMARYMLGQKETARTALEKAVKATTDFTGIDKAREYLTRLDGTGGTDSESTIESLTERLRKTPGDSRRPHRPGRTARESREISGSRRQLRAGPEKQSAPARCPRRPCQSLFRAAGRLRQSCGICPAGAGTG